MRIETPLKDRQTFNDGICEVVALKNAAKKGNLPEPELSVRYRRVPFEKRSAGVQRRFLAGMEGVQIDFLIRIPADYRVSTLDVCRIGKDVYTVRSVQHIAGTLPPSQDLELERSDNIYDIAGLSRSSPGDNGQSISL